MKDFVPYLALSGQTVTLERLEEACAEIGHLLQGAILNLRDIPARDGLGEEQCARLSLTLGALQYLTVHLEVIFPASD